MKNLLKVENGDRTVEGVDGCVVRFIKDKLLSLRISYAFIGVEDGKVYYKEIGDITEKSILCPSLVNNEMRIEEENVLDIHIWIGMCEFRIQKTRKGVRTDIYPARITCKNWEDPYYGGYLVDDMTKVLAYVKENDGK